MRYKDLLLEYNQTSLLKTFGKKLLSRWVDSEDGRDLETFGDLQAANPAEASETERLIALLDWMQERGDPTPNGKYMTWIVRRYIDGTIRQLEDIPSRIGPALNKYMRLGFKGKLKAEHKDINKIQNLEKILMTDYSDEETETSSQKERKKSQEQAYVDAGELEIVMNDKDYKIVIPKTEEVSCLYGRNTTWCTASSNSYNYFDSYNKKGDLYIIMDKNADPGGDESGFKESQKYQFHFTDKMYMDEMDNPIDIMDFAKNHKKAMGAIINHVGGLGAAAILDLENFGELAGPEKILKYIESLGDINIIIFDKIYNYLKEQYEDEPASHLPENIQQKVFDLYSSVAAEHMYETKPHYTTRWQSHTQGDGLPWTKEFEMYFDTQLFRLYEDGFIPEKEMHNLRWYASNIVEEFELADKNDPNMETLFNLRNLVKSPLRDFEDDRINRLVQKRIGLQYQKWNGREEIDKINKSDNMRDAMRTHGEIIQKILGQAGSR